MSVVTAHGGLLLDPRSALQGSSIRHLSRPGNACHIFEHSSWADVSVMRLRSNSQCVTPVQMVSIDLCGAAVAVNLAGPVVELVGDGVELVLAETA